MTNRSRGEIIFIKVNNNNHYSYVSDQEEVGVLSSLHWKLHPGIPTKSIHYVCDTLGQRTNFEYMVNELNRGDVLGVSTIAALEDVGKPKSLIQRLRKLNAKGVTVTVAYGPTYHFALYDTMVRQQAELEDQREFYRSTCVPTIECYEKTHAAPTTLKGGE